MSIREELRKLKIADWILMAGMVCLVLMIASALTEQWWGIWWSLLVFLGLISLAGIFKLHEFFMEARDSDGMD